MFECGIRRAIAGRSCATLRTSQKNVVIVACLRSRTLEADLPQALPPSSRHYYAPAATWLSK